MQIYHFELLNRIFNIKQCILKSLQIRRDFEDFGKHQPTSNATLTTPRSRLNSQRIKTMPTERNQVETSNSDPPAAYFGCLELEPRSTTLLHKAARIQVEIQL